MSDQVQSKAPGEGVFPLSRLGEWVGFSHSDSELLTREGAQARSGDGVLRGVVKGCGSERERGGV